MNFLLVIQLVVFVLGTIFIVLISKRSLKSLKYHGFYRFFVFELTLILLILNIPHWFDHPFTGQQIVSWILLFISILLLVQSLYFFKKYGASEKRGDNTANFEFENTTTLIQEGIYKYIRHPMYGSLLFLNLGAMLKNVSVITVSLAAAAIIFVVLTAKIEEKENINFFGKDYERYMKKTKMFIPFIF
ncbi:MAG: isoprenylcysteine carboxylmethyltransferase family protein [Ignavibacteria bacterium]|jgi:protein-S-isoprenylcysteine O-methyltransferase Ste14